MSFNAYDERLAKLAEDFINTFDLYLEQPEHLQTPEDLRRFLNAHGIKPDQVTLEDLEQTRLLRSQVREIWTAPTLEESIRLLNPLLEKVSIGVQVTHDSEDSTHLAFSIQPTTLVSWLGAECALGIAAALQHHGLERLRACAAEPCRDVFIDTSRNKSRRFCSDRCANRYNIAAFRDRQKPD